MYAVCFLIIMISCNYTLLSFLFIAKLSNTLQYNTLLVALYSVHTVYITKSCQACILISDQQSVLSQNIKTYILLYVYNNIKLHNLRSAIKSMLLLIQNQFNSNFTLFFCILKLLLFS